jgi:cytochrome P450
VFPQIVGLKKISARALLDYGAMVFDVVGPDNAVRRRSLENAATVVPQIMEQCQRENLEPGGIGDTIYTHADAGEISAEEAGLLVRSLLSAGVDTTVTGIGSLLYCLAANPEQFAKLKADPKLARPAFEEVLRFRAPVHAFYRTAGQDTEVSGVTIAEGTKILCSLASGNLDETHWPDAATFDISRKTHGHLGMGVGIHGCVGQNLARAEVNAVLAELIAQVDKIAFDGDPVWRPGNAIRALSHLPLRFS